MKYLLYYKLDSKFVSDQMDAGGDGTKVVSVVDGVAWTDDAENVYYRLSSEASAVTSYTVTVYYKNIFGETISPNVTVSVEVYNEDGALYCVSAKSISGYTLIKPTDTVLVSGNTEYTFTYVPGSSITKVPLTFQVLTDGIIRWSASGNLQRKIKYQKNGSDWTEITSNRVQDIPVAAGDLVSFIGDNSNYAYVTGNTRNHCSFSATTCEFNVYGNIMSLIKSKDFFKLREFTSANTFYSFFNGCTTMKDASNLLLPAKRLVQNCYIYMFKNCTNLIGVPELPANELAYQCYYQMFAGCTSLEKAQSKLPAQNTTAWCYNGMFSGCTSLTGAPEIMATYAGGYSAFGSMFFNCTSLTGVPDLHLMSFDNSDVNFHASNMFSNCTSLKKAPALPATNLGMGCYNAMFTGCTALEEAPVLPATDASIAYCYRYMFSGCTNLRYIKCLAIRQNGYDAFREWHEGAQTVSGTFVKHPDATWGYGSFGVPNNWTIVDADDV